MSEKCIYCEEPEIKSDSESVRLYHDIPIDRSVSDEGIAIFLVNESWLKIEVSVDSFVYECAVDINYCPMCGRKLSEVVVDE